MENGSVHYPKAQLQKMGVVGTAESFSDHLWKYARENLTVSPSIILER